MRVGSLFIIGVTLFAAACSVSLGGELLEERTESFSLQQGARLSIQNVNGNVRIDPWDGSDVEVTLSIFGNTAQGIPEGFSTEVSSTPSSLEYRVRYPEGISNMSAAFLIRVPLELALRTDVEITNGNISVLGPHTVNLETTNGNISVEGAAGGAGAETTNGNITATFAGVTEGMALATVNGNIRVVLPGETGFTAETVNGRVGSTGFSVESSSRTGVTVSGPGGVKLGTVNGNVTVEGF